MITPKFSKKFNSNVDIYCLASYSTNPPLPVKTIARKDALIVGNTFTLRKIIQLPDQDRKQEIFK